MSIILPIVTVHDESGLEALPVGTIVTELYELTGFAEHWTYEVMDYRENAGYSLRRIHSDPVKSCMPCGEGYVVYPVLVDNPEILGFDFEEGEGVVIELGDVLRVGEVVYCDEVHELPEGSVLVVGEDAELYLERVGK